MTSRNLKLEDALFVGVVKQIIGGSYMEERDAKRDMAVRSWWDLLQLDMKCSDPGRTAMSEKGLVDIYKNGLEILDASLGVKSSNTHEEVVRCEDLQPMGSAQHGDLMD